MIYLTCRDLEEELTVVGKNLQQLEVGEEQTRVREEKLQAQIMDLRYPHHLVMGKRSRIRIRIRIIYFLIR